jgi:Fe-S oxidoreductase
VQTFVVACPKDIAMFRDAVKTTGHEDKIVVKDLAELVAEAKAD